MIGKPKEKTLQNYRLVEKISEDPLGIVVYKAVHQNNVDQFMIKQAPVRNQQLHDQRNIDTAGILESEIQKVKQINCHRILKCIQRIKTKRNIYLVYESFLQCSLKEYLSKFEPSFMTRINIAKIICETIQEIHRKCFVYLNLGSHSVFVDKKTKDLKFIGLEYAVRMSTLQSKKIQNQEIYRTQFCAPETIQSGIVTYQSDLYSLGKLIQSLNLINPNEDISHTIKQCFDSLLNKDASGRDNINRVWSCLKMLQNQNNGFKQNMSTRIKLTVTKPSETKFMNTGSGNRFINDQTKLGIPKDKRMVEEDERKIRKLLKIRNLILFLHDLANFSLSENDKQLFFLLLKKGGIIRANLLRQCKKMVIPTGSFKFQMKKIIDVLEQEQTSSLNLLTRVQQALSNNKTMIPKLKIQLENRKQLDETFLQQKVRQFVAKKKKDIKIFHTSSDVQQRMKLVNLCGMSEKLVYGSFQTFFDQVVDENIVDMNEQKHFEYLRKGSTREMLDRLDRIIKNHI